MKIGSVLFYSFIAAAISLLIIDILIRIEKFSGFFRSSDLIKAKKQLAVIQNMVINKITAKKTAIESFETILEAIIYITVNMFHAGTGCILLYNREKKGLEIAASEGLPQQFKKQIDINKDSHDNIAWGVFENNKPLLIKNLKIRKEFHFSDDSIYKGNSLMCVPIKTHEATMGVCLIANPLKRRPFSDDSIDILSSIAGQVALVVDNHIYEQKLSVKMNELKTLYQVSEQISHSLDLQTTLDNIAQLAINISRTDACSLRLLNSATNQLELMAAMGLSSHYRQKGSLRIGEGVGGYVAKEGKAVTIPDLKKDKRVKYTSYLAGEGLKSLVSVPIKDDEEKVIGIISVYKKTYYEFPPEIIGLLSTFANNVSVAIKNAKLFDTIEKSYYQTIQSLTLAVDARDAYTNGHSQRVTDLAVRIAEEIGLNYSKVQLLNLACRLHDIGKIGISDQILLKKGRLTPDEYDHIKTHPLKGIELLGPLKFLNDILPIVKYHHERYDGKGYPEGLSGDRIPILARILSVADVYDAMTSDRPYRPALSEKKAEDELIANSGTQFDPSVVDAFIRLKSKYKAKSEI